MKRIDQYHRWVEWRDDDQVDIGKCHELITGIHGDDPVQVYRELGEASKPPRFCEASLRG